MDNAHTDRPHRKEQLLVCRELEDAASRNFERKYGLQRRARVNETDADSLPSNEEQCALSRFHETCNILRAGTVKIDWLYCYNAW